jgi:hypothetical protein
VNTEFAKPHSIGQEWCTLELFTYIVVTDILKKTTVMLYETLIRRVLTFGSETWTLFKKSQSVLSIFERKI